MLTSILNEKATKVLNPSSQNKTIMPCGMVSSKNNVIIDTYLQYYSFSYDENENYYTSNDKQFLRYISKVKTELENILMNYVDNRYSAKAGNQKYTGLKAFIIMHLDITLSKTNLYADNRIINEYISDIKHPLNVSCYLDSTIDSETKRLFRKKDSNSEKNNYSDCPEDEMFLSKRERFDDVDFDEIVNNAFFQACKKYIRSKAARNLEINNKDIYHNNMNIIGLPDSIEDYIRIFDDVVNIIYTDVKILSLFEENSESNNAINLENEKKLFDETLKNTKSEYEKEKNLILKQLKKSEKEKDVLLNKIKKLETTHNEKNKKARDVTNKALSQNTSLLKENDKLRKEMQILQDKLAKSEGKEEVKPSKNKSNINSEDLQEQEIIEDEAINIKKDFDTQGRYLFVACDNNFLYEKIKKNFPNSKITKKSVNIRNMKLDAVILITSCIKHNVYYEMKDICKAAGVPFISCRNYNIDKMKELFCPELEITN